MQYVNYAITETGAPLTTTAALGRSPRPRRQARPATASDPLSAGAGSATVVESPIDPHLRAVCQQFALRQVRLPQGEVDLDALVGSVVETSVDSVLRILRHLLRETLPVAAPPPIAVVRDAAGQPSEYRCRGFALPRGRAGDQWEIMRVLVDSRGAPRTVKDLQQAVDGSRIPGREKVIRTRLAELSRRFPNAIIAETVSGEREKRYRLVAEVVETQTGTRHSAAGTQHAGREGQA